MMDPTSMAYRATEAYVKDNHPDLEPIFASIWENAIKQKQNTQKLETLRLQNREGSLSFLSDDSVVQLSQFVIPFVIGVISQIVADAISNRIDFSRAKTMMLVKAETEKYRINVRVDKELTEKALPYIVEEILNNQNLTT